jgi:hypothetical protein
VRADHPIHRIVERQTKLLTEMFAQRTPIIGDVLNPALVGLKIARATAAHDWRRKRRAIRNAAGIVGLPHISIERRRGLGRQTLRLRVLRHIHAFAQPLRLLIRCRTLRVRTFGPVVALQQRIPLEFLLDEARHLDIGILQQLDRLTQLRRHDKRLRLPKIEAWP